MPDPTKQSIVPFRDNLEAAERMQHAIRCGVAALEAARCELLYRIRQIPTGEPPLVDGEPARVDGEDVDLVEWLRSRAEGLCLHGYLADAIFYLTEEATSDPVERLARYIREARR